MKNKILYQLTTEDFQNIAVEEIGRKLSAKETEKVLGSVEKRIAWHSIIADSLTEIKSQRHLR